MTLSQIEYFLAVVKYKSFNEAAEHLNLTQPTLSMQIKKLEEELETQLIDRSINPLVLTKEGEIFIEQAEKIIFEKNKAISIIENLKTQKNKHLNIGIIPTLAPYFIPLISDLLLTEENKFEIKIWEIQTNGIIQKLENQELDFGIMSTPLKEEKLDEKVLFYEKLMLYCSPNYSLLEKNEVVPEDLDLKDIWLLNDGNCLSAQVKNLCGDLIDELARLKRFNYKAGSLETLKRMVEWKGGFTILPELMVANFNDEDLTFVRPFKSPFPTREISIVTSKYNLKEDLVDEFSEKIKAILPKKLLQNKNFINILEI